MNIVHLGATFAKVKLTPEELYRVRQCVDERFHARQSDRGVVNQIKYEKDINSEGIKIINSVVAPYVEEFVVEILGHDKMFQLELFTSWINKQKALEFRLTHSHRGDISFAFYPYVSKEIYDEKPTNMYMKPGAIAFRYCYDAGPTDNGRFKPTRVFSVVPEEGDLFIFPSWLMHEVNKFDTPNAERISIVGNFRIRM